MKTKFMITAVIFFTAIFTGCSDSDKDLKDLSVKGINLSKSTISMKPGNTETLTVTFFPENAADKTISWESSDETIATVSSQGLVTAIKPGDATISATSNDGGEKATCSVTVSYNDPVTVKGDVQGVWEKYTVINVTGHINVPAGKTLSIEEGVEVIVSSAGQDENNTKIEILVNGSLFCYGTEENPVTFTVPANERTTQNTFSRLWGGIVGSTTCEAIVFDNVIVEYTGAVTTRTSPTVVSGLFKPTGGEGMVAFNTNNPAGKYVIINSIFRNTGEDAIYVQGGSCIFVNNLFYAIGEAGGEAINVKAGCKVDAAFNVIYGSNTNALKFSNSGADGGARYQAQVNGYNNTIINSGWRRDPNKPKGGSGYFEEGCLVFVYNNLVVNCMFGMKAPDFGVDAAEGPDLNSKIDYNYYASGTAQSAVPQHISNGTITAHDGFKANVKDVVYGEHDKRGNAAGELDPKFVNFPFMANPLLSYSFDKSWNFHLQAGSPALTGAKTDFSPYYSSTGIVINGKTYKSPLPAAYFGAFGTVN